MPKNPVLDLSSLFQDSDDGKEIYESINKFFDVNKYEYDKDGKIKRIIPDVDGKTQLSRKDVINITSIEIMIQAFKQHFDYYPLILKVLIERWKVNAISMDRKGREEFVKILSSMFRMEVEEEKRQSGLSINRMLNRQ